MNRLDQIVIGAFDIAQTEALKRRHTELSPYHLIFGLIKNPQSSSSQILVDQLSSVEAELDKLATSDAPTNLESIKPTRTLSEWLTKASSQAVQSGKEAVSEEDLLEFIHEAAPKIKKPKLSQTGQQQKTPEFLHNLNERALEGKLDPVIGRTREIRSVVEILGRRNKNNPVLVGPAGVGKTAIVEGLADQIVKGKVPDVLAGKTVYSLDLGQLMAGTKFRGEFEERMQTLLKFIKQAAGQAILFIDEMHQIVGAGKTDGAMDAANLLKPALARGELHCIGATTLDEYQKYILGDAALDRRFRPVMVDEPSKEDSIEILMGIRDKHEMHHGIKISDEAIYSAVMLSSQYITNKHLPDKAIDLVDEAASALKLSAEAMPAELAEKEAEIRSKKILAKVHPDDRTITEDIKQLEESFMESKQKWEEEVDSLRKLASVKNTLDRAKFDLEKAEREGKYEEASRIKYSVIPELEQQLESQQTNWILQPANIASVVSRQTGIPVEKIMQDRQEKILELESHIKSKVFGQDEAVHEIAETLVTAYAGLSDPSKPLGSFLLSGPTGVGKTETAKAVTEFLFDHEDRMIRIDLSEFSEKHSVAKLIGAPAGYVGYDDGGVLTEAVRRKPYSLILFDEVEKAHPDFSDILLQILDDGRLTDNKGRTISFKNTVVMLTTNSKNLHADFKPEVLGRLDAKLEFKPLEKGIMQELVKKQFKELNERLKTKKLSLTPSDKLINYLAEIGYDQNFGARPLHSVFQRVVSRQIAHQLVKGEIEAGEHTLDWDGNKVVTS